MVLERAIPLILGIVAAGVLQGCGASESTGSARNATLELTAASEIATLDPRWATRALDVRVTRLVHAGLMRLDPDSLEPVPHLASRVEWISPHRLEIDLKPGVRFHSGQELRAEDVCATLAAGADPTLGSPHRSVAAALGGCSVDSQHRLHLELRQARATVLTDLEIPILRADQARRAPSAEGQLDGLGPFRVGRVAPGQVELLPANTGLKAQPRQGLVVRTVRDENARALRLLAGRTDIAPNVISPTLLPALEQRGLQILTRPGANLTYLLMQNDRAPFDRAAVRRAVAHAVDRKRIAETLFAGKAQVAEWVFPPGHWARPADLPPIPYDPAAAQHTLSGVAPVELLTGTDRLRVTIARAMAQMLGEAGLPVQVVSVDLGVLLSRLDAGDFDLACLQMPEVTEPNLLAWFFHPAGVPGEGGLGRNRARYRSTAAGELLDIGATSTDRTVRRRVYGELAHLMQKDMPIVPLWHEDHVTLVSSRARMFRPSAEGRWLGLAQL